MSRFAPRAHGDQPRDVGFTLIEVVWALVLLGIIAMASLGLFTNGLKSVAHVQRQQAAVSVANSAMDTARSVAGGAVNADKTSGLVRGRSEEAVNAAWGAADPSDVSDMEKVWDHESGLHDSDQWVPIHSTARVDSQTYTITTLVGKCYRLKAASTSSQDCIPGKDGDTSYSLMYRVRVVVTWDEGTKVYSYRLSTLVDPTDDPTWNTELDPYAYDEEVSVDAGMTQQPISVVANDTVEYNTDGSKSPIINLSAPTPHYGTITKGGPGQLGNVYFDAPADVSGTVTFTYDVEGSNGKKSTNHATVTVHILPVPVPDTIYVPTGSTTTLNAQMLANDLGLTNIDPTRKTTIVPVWDPDVNMFATEDVTQEIQDARAQDAQHLANHGVSMSGDNVVFHAPDEKKNTTFYYFLVDDPISGDAIRHPSTTYVAVTVSTEDPPMYTPNFTVTNLIAQSNASASPIPWLSKSGNLGGTQIVVQSGITGPGTQEEAYNHVLVGGTDPYASDNTTSSTLGFLNDAAIGTYTIPYKVKSSSGVLSDTSGTITVKVVPYAPSYDFGSVKYTRNNGNRYVDIDLGGAGILPTSGVKVINIKKVGNTNCTVPASSTSTTIRITGVSNNRQCQFTYQLASKSDGALTSGTGTITFKATS